MKSFVISIILGVCIVWGSVFYINNLQKSSEEMMSVNNQISEHLKAEDYAAASEKISELKSYLEERHEYMSAFGNHEELDNIYSNLLEMEKYAECGFKDDALAKCAVLGMLFEHLPQNYRLRWENIF